MNRYARVLAAVASVAALVLTSCSSSTNGSGSSSPTPPAVSSTTSAPPTTSAVQSSPASGSETITPDQVSAALLTPIEVGHGFKKAQFQPSSDPLPCLPNDAPLEVKYPATVQAGTAIVSTKVAASMSEEARLFADPETAQQALAYIGKGLNCSSGPLNLTGSAETVTIGSEHDVSASVNADAALAVQVTSPRYDIVLAAARVGRILVLFAFLRTQATPTSALPNPITIMGIALNKIKTS